LSLQAGTGGAVRLRGGWAIQQACDRLVEAERLRSGRRFLPLGSVHLTTAGELPFRALLHCVAVDDFHASSAETIRACVTGALAVAEREGFDTLAMPVFATGNGRFPFASALVAMRHALDDYEGEGVERVWIAVRDRHRVEEALEVLGRAPVAAAGDRRLFPHVEAMYLSVLHGNAFTGLSVPGDCEFGLAARAAAAELGPPQLERLLWENDWRPRLVAGWLAGATLARGLAPRLGRLLLASEFPFACQAYCFAMASFADDAAALALERYLDTWLPRLDCPYDQHWALAALRHVDAARGTRRAGRFLAAGGPWAEFSAHNRMDHETPFGKLAAMLAFAEDLRARR
jgi:O-acetyl-ADP-ribose deacetylase (regulator of RNase III)